MTVLFTKLGAFLASLIALFSPVAHFGGTGTMSVASSTVLADGTALQASTTINDFVTKLWNGIQASETTYIKNNGNYWQGISNVDTPPIGGKYVAAAKADQTFGPYAYTLNTLGVATSSPVQFRVDEYKSRQPDGTIALGYQAVFFVNIGGTVYGKSFATGEEGPLRTFDWR